MLARVVSISDFRANRKAREVRGIRERLPAGTLERLLLVLKERPRDPVVLKLIGKHYRGLAALTLQKILSEDPGVGPGSIAEWKAHLERACKAFTPAVRGFEASGRMEEAARTRLILGMTHLDLENNEEAVAELTKAIPDLAEKETRSLANAYLSIALQDLGRFSEAIRAELQAAPSYPRWMTLSRLGSIHKSMGANEKALDLLHAAIDDREISRESVSNILLDIAEANLALGRCKSGEVALKSIVRAPESSEETRFLAIILLASLFGYLGRILEAKETISCALEREESPRRHAILEVLLAKVLLASGRPKEGEKMLRGIVEAPEDRAESGLGAACAAAAALAFNRALGIEKPGETLRLLAKAVKRLKAEGGS